MATEEQKEKKIRDSFRATPGGFKSVKLTYKGKVLKEVKS